MAPPEHPSGQEQPDHTSSVTKCFFKAVNTHNPYCVLRRQLFKGFSGLFLTSKSGRKMMSHARKSVQIFPQTTVEEFWVLFVSLRVGIIQKRWVFNPSFQKALRLQLGLEQPSLLWFVKQTWTLLQARSLGGSGRAGGRGGGVFSRWWLQIPEEQKASHVKVKGKKPHDHIRISCLCSVILDSYWTSLIFNHLICGVG